MGRAFSSSYLAGEGAAAAFLPRDFRQRADRIAAARRAAGRAVDPSLIAALRAQQATLPPSAARDHNLEALAGGRCAVVASGQQVGLFLGPLYTFYKAASAIAVARAIEEESGVRCVPLFWLQTEDHDFEEIAACTTAGADGAPVRLALSVDGPAVGGGARVSVAHRELGPEVAGLLDTLADLLGAAPAGGEVMAVLRAHYRPGRAVAAAFAGALAEVFADEGLLFLDPRDARVAALAAPIYRRAITGAAEIDALLARQEQRLAAAGFDCQVGVRAGSPLVFFHPHGATGPRHRLRGGDGDDSGGEPGDGGAGDTDPAGERWRLDGGGATFSTADLLDALAREPLGFSTSALLRPLVQDALLPTAAYVGGPAELSYFAQLEPLYGFFEVSPALVVPRARFRCIEAPARRWLEALGLAPDEVARPLPELLARVAGGGGTSAPVAGDGAGAADAAGDSAPPAGELRRRIVDEIAPAVAELTAAAIAAEPSLARAGERTRASVTRALRRFADRYARARAERDGVTRARLERLRAALYPGGVAQERVFGWPTLAARVGPAELKRLVFASIAAAGPFATALQELRP